MLWANELESYRIDRKGPIGETRRSAGDCLSQHVPCLFAVTFSGQEESPYEFGLHGTRAGKRRKRGANLAQGIRETGQG